MIHLKTLIGVFWALFPVSRSRRYHRWAGENLSKYRRVVGRAKFILEIPNAFTPHCIAQACKIMSGLEKHRKLGREIRQRSRGTFNLLEGR